MKLISTLVLAVALVCGGCLTSGKTELNPAGVYQSDTALYQADLALSSTYAVFDAFLAYEYQNRAALADHPNITAFAEKLRRESPQWFKSAIALRDAYASAPGSQEARTSLESSLAVLRAAAAEATRYLVSKPTTQ